MDYLAVNSCNRLLSHVVTAVEQTVGQQLTFNSHYKPYNPHNRNKIINFNNLITLPRALGCLSVKRTCRCAASNTNHMNARTNLTNNLNQYNELTHSLTRSLTLIQFYKQVSE